MKRALVAACVLAVPMVVLAGEDATAMRVTERSFSEVAIPIERSAPATVETRAEAMIAARITAPVIEIPVRTGSRVSAGDLLVRLECGDFEDRLAEARARLEELEARSRFAQSQRVRAERLRRDQSISAEELDRTAADAAATGAAALAQHTAVRAAERDVARCDVTAPYGGVVTERSTGIGALVQPGTPLVRLVDGARIELHAQLRQRDAREIDPGAKAEFRANGQRYAVVLEDIVAGVDAAGRTQEAVFGFTDQMPLPGTPGRVVWELDSGAVPADLVVRRDDQLGVMLIEADRARFHPLPDAVEGRPASADLPDDARIIVRGRYAVHDGDAVAAEPAGNG